MQPDNPLDKLKDIYLPERISQWPVTYGWWLVLAGILLVIAIFFLIRYIKKIIKARREAKVQSFANEMVMIQQKNPAEFVQEISVYLKRVAIHKYPKESIKQLHGKAWLEFLDSKIKTTDFTMGTGQELANSYKLEILSAQRADELLELAKDWLRVVL